MGLFGMFKKPAKAEPEKANTATKKAAKSPEFTVQQIEAEKKQYEQMAYKLPEEVDGNKVKYHYQGIRCTHSWQYGGQYGKALTDLSWRVGEPLEIRYVDTERNRAAYYLFKAEIEEPVSYAPYGRFTGMIEDWFSANKPVKVCFTGIDHEMNLMVEIAFYGYAKKRTQSDR